MTCRQHSLAMLSCRMCCKAFHKSEITARNVDFASLWSGHSLGYEHHAYLPQEIRRHELASLLGHAYFWWPSLCQKTLLVLDSPFPDNEYVMADLQFTCSCRQSGLRIRRHNNILGCCVTYGCPSSHLLLLARASASSGLLLPSGHRRFAAAG